MAPPVTDPHSTTGPSYTCEACDPPVTLRADTEKALQRLVDAHNAELHPA